MDPMPFRAYPRRRKPAETQGLFTTPAKPSPESRLIAHIDGGARGNPGPAGFGVVIEDGTGRPIAELSKFLGHQTNNYAEYMGLLAALQYALEYGAKALEVISDSELLVRQINGQYKVRNLNLLDLYKQAKSLIAKLEWFSIGHVLRGKNKQADALANRAMDEGMGKR
jgi:ribonuclease HI